MCSRYCSPHSFFAPTLFLLPSCLNLGILHTTSFYKEDNGGDNELDVLKLLEEDFLDAFVATYLIENDRE